MTLVELCSFALVATEYPVTRINNIDISATVTAVISGFLITQGRKSKKEKEAFLLRYCELAA